MKYRRLGTSDVKVSEISLGCWTMGALKPKLAKLKERFGATTEDLAALAQRYLLNHPNLACVIPGFRNERQALK